MQNTLITLRLEKKSTEKLVSTSPTHHFTHSTRTTRTHAHTKVRLQRTYAVLDSPHEDGYEGILGPHVLHLLLLDLDMGLSFVPGLPFQTARHGCPTMKLEHSPLTRSFRVSAAAL